MQMEMFISTLCGTLADKTGIERKAEITLKGCRK